MAKNTKTGDRFFNNGNEYIVTNIQVPGTFCIYAINVKSGEGVRVRTDFHGIPFYVVDSVV